MIHSCEYCHIFSLLQLILCVWIPVKSLAYSVYQYTDSLNSIFFSAKTQSQNSQKLQYHHSSYHVQKLCMQLSSSVHIPTRIFSSYNCLKLRPTAYLAGNIYFYILYIFNIDIISGVVWVKFSTIQLQIKTLVIAAVEVALVMMVGQDDKNSFSASSFIALIITNPHVTSST